MNKIFACRIDRKNSKIYYNINGERKEWTGTHLLQFLEFVTICNNIN